MHRSGSRLASLIVTVSVLALGSCSTTASPDTPPSAANSSDGFDRLVKVDSNDVFVQCRGAGTPPVVLISGAGVSATGWDYVGDTDDTVNPPVQSTESVESQVALSTQVCAYDRPGTVGFDDTPSRSTPVRQPTTAQSNAETLHDALAAAGIGGPYVLVGHSWGGFIATTFSRMYPSDVAGMVLIDPGSQYLQEVLSAKVWSDWMSTITAAGAKQATLEQPDYPNSIAFLEALPSAPPVPTVVLTSDKPIDFLGTGEAKKYHREWVKAQSMLARSLEGTQITKTQSGHFIQASNPELVTQVIEDVLSKSRQD